MFKTEEELLQELDDMLEIHKETKVVSARISEEDMKWVRKSKYSPKQIFELAIKILKSRE